MRVLPSILGALVIACSAASASAHGGQYKSPAAPGSDSPNPSRAPGTSGHDWTDWWWANRDRYIDLARRLRRAEAAGTGTRVGGLGAVAGADGGPAPEDPGLDPRAFHEKFVLPVVTRALSDGEAEVRSAAAVALGKMGFPRSLLDLEKAMKDPHPDVRDGAILALGMIRDDLALETLRSLLFDTAVRERTRAFAAVAIGLEGGTESAKTLLHFISPESDAEREGGLLKTTDLLSCSVLSAGRTESPAAIPEVRRLYASAGLLPPVPRACAAVALGRLGDRESIPLLLKGLRHHESGMRQCAALALGVLGKPTDGAVLAALAKTADEDNDAGTRQFCLMALGRVSGPGGKEALRPFLEAGRPKEDLAFVVLALGIAGDRPSAPAIRRVFREEAQIRGAAAIALGLLGDREAAAEIRAVGLGKGDPGLRGHCLTSLGLMGDVDSAPALLRLVAEEENPRLRLAAAVSLGILGDPAAVPALARLSRQGGSVNVRAHSCYFLGLIGTVAAARTLIEVVEDPQEKMVVRMYAVAGLGALADRSPVPMLSGLSADADYLLPVDAMQEVLTFL